MKMPERVTVKKNERALLLRNGDFERVLQPGTHWLFSPIDALRVEVFALEQAAFTHGLADYLVRPEQPQNPRHCLLSGRLPMVRVAGLRPNTPRFLANCTEVADGSEVPC